jgi:CRISPR-associated protein Csa3
LIADEWSRNKGLPKVQEAAKALNLKTEIVNVKSYDVINIATRMKEVIRANRGNHIILNITGGTKIMAIAGTLAGIATGDIIEDVIYITEDEQEVISIPRLPNPEKLLSPEKREILQAISKKDKLTADELHELIKGQMQVIWKHLRELEEIGYVRSTAEKPRKYTLTESGWLLT